MKIILFLIISAYLNFFNVKAELDSFPLGLNITNVEERFECLDREYYKNKNTTLDPWICEAITEFVIPNKRFIDCYDLNLPIVYFTHLFENKTSKKIKKSGYLTTYQGKIEEGKKRSKTCLYYVRLKTIFIFIKFAYS